MQEHIMKKILIIALAVLLAGCEQAPTPFTAQPFAFELNTAAPLGINVSRITINDAYRPPLKRPFVEQEFPVAPATAVHKWVDRRLKATGQSGVLEITITDASVQEVKLPKTKGFKGLITDDQDARYDAKLAVSFKLYSGKGGISDASGDVTISRSRSINERATVYQREAIYHQMTMEMMNDFERETNARLKQYFSNYLN
jgi:hypothetical protein